MMDRGLRASAGAAFLLLATSFIARADGIPRPVFKSPRPSVTAYNWTGFYAGINGGSGFDTSNFASHSVKIRSKGALIGGTFGYNLQTGSTVWGVETDLDWSDASGRGDCGAFVCEARNDWLGTLRGRIGYGFGRWLPYVTAGMAYGHVTASSTDPAAADAGRTRVGWTAGLGIEHAFSANWSAKLEYLYVCLGDVSRNSVCDTGVTTSNISIKESVVRAGVNYKFNGPIFSKF